MMEGQSQCLADWEYLHSNDCQISSRFSHCVPDSYIQLPVSISTWMSYALNFKSPKLNSLMPPLPTPSILVLLLSSSSQQHISVARLRKEKHHTPHHLCSYSSQKLGSHPWLFPLLHSLHLTNSWWFSFLNSSKDLFIFLKTHCQCLSPRWHYLLDCDTSVLAGLPASWLLLSNLRYTLELEWSFFNSRLIVSFLLPRLLGLSRKLRHMYKVFPHFPLLTSPKSFLTNFIPPCTLPC